MFRSVCFGYEANKIAKTREHEHLNVLVHICGRDQRPDTCVSFRFGVFMVTHTNIQRLRSFRTTTEKFIETQKPRANLLATAVIVLFT